MELVKHDYLGNYHFQRGKFPIKNATCNQPKLKRWHRFPMNLGNRRVIAGSRNAMARTAVEAAGYKRNGGC